MSKPKGGLGRGLGSLIGPAATPVISASPVIVPAPAPTPVADFAPEPVDTGESDLQIRQVSPNDISENPHQPRTYFSEHELSDLKASILEHGILQPLVVTESSKGKYELIAGERRLRASRALGLEKIPVVVRPPADDQQKLELALIENIQRQDLNPVEEARAYRALIDQFDLRQEDIAGRVGKARSTVANSLRLLELDEDVLEALAGGKITAGHARTLLAEPVPSRRRELFQQMLTGKMTVREAEARAGVKHRKTAEGKDPNVAALEAELREKLGTKVVIEMQGGAGKVVVHFYSREDLKELVKRFTERDA